MSRHKMTKRRAKYAVKNDKLSAPPCLNCGKKERHYVPPSLGEAGFFICKERKIT